VTIDRGSNNTIDGNVIAGNNDDGVLVHGEGAAGNVITNNKIGIANSNAALPNGDPDDGSGNGIEMRQVVNHRILGNSISNNYSDGIFVTGASRRVLISGNRLSNNGGLGIDLSANSGTADGPTANDEGDSDVGGNDQQNHPVLTSAMTNGAQMSFGGELSSEPNETYTIEYFSNDVANCDPEGFGEGQTYLGSATVTTNSAGKAALPKGSFTTQLGRAITATATDSENNTSEFSACGGILVADGDGDNDGLFDDEEASKKADPADPDSDDDGTSDGSLDPDGEGAIVAGPDGDNEDPCVPNVNAVNCTDVDHDGVEMDVDPNDNDACIPSANNPACADSDGDGPVDRNDPAPNDPCVPNASVGSCDQDQDGLTNDEEVEEGTTATDSDSDDDGELDGDDISPLDVCDPHQNAAECQDADDDGEMARDDSDDANPCVPVDTVATCDKDNDGLTNAEEASLGTDKSNPDSDGDGVGDKEDACPKIEGNPENGCNELTVTGGDQTLDIDNNKITLGPEFTGKLTIRGVGNKVFGSDLGNEIHVIGCGNVVNGSGGSDTIVVECGNAAAKGAGSSTARNIVSGGAARDFITARGKIGARLVGGEGNDIIKGSAGADELLGDAGIDSLIGGGGADRMFGGASSDSIRAPRLSRFLAGKVKVLMVGGDGMDGCYGTAKKRTCEIV
jgi:parallel beta-helix repeat protein